MISARRFVAGGMKVALITTVGGLVVALILQVFYNYLLSKLEAILNQMEDASIFAGYGYQIQP